MSRVVRASFASRAMNVSATSRSNRHTRREMCRGDVARDNSIGITRIWRSSFSAWESWFWACIVRARPRWRARSRPWDSTSVRPRTSCPPTIGNPEGYFELLSVVRANDDLLAHFGGRWDSPPDLTPEWTDDDVSDGIRADDARAPGRTLRRAITTSSRTRESRSCCRCGDRSPRTRTARSSSCATRWKWRRHCIDAMVCRC